MAEEWPDLRTLELLVTVADAGSLNAAAEILGIAQPNASRLVRTLEHQLGTRLLLRSPSGSAATEDGALVVAHARELLSSASGLLEVVGNRRRDRVNMLTVGSSLTITEYLLPRWVAELRRRLPEVRPELRAMNSAQVFAAIDAGDCTVGFVETPSIPRRFARQLVHVDELYVVVAGAHPWARHNSPVSVDELAATALVTREPGSGTRKTLERALREHEVVPPLQELGSNAAVLASACAGLGPAALSKLVVDAAIRAGALVRVDIEGLSLRRRIHAVWPATEHLDDAASTLIQVARQHSAALRPQGPVPPPSASPRSSRGAVARRP